MIYITLVCNLGMSTSMLMSKMKKSAEAKGIEVDIAAMADSKLASTERKTDILLLGPQLSFMYEEFVQKYQRIPHILVIDQLDYGMMNGEKVLQDALEKVAE